MAKQGHTCTERMASSEGSVRQHLWRCTSVDISFVVLWRAFANGHAVRRCTRINYLAVSHVYISLHSFLHGASDSAVVIAKTRKEQDLRFVSKPGLNLLRRQTAQLSEPKAAEHRFMTSSTHQACSLRTFLPLTIPKIRVLDNPPSRDPICKI